MGEKTDRDLNHALRNISPDHIRHHTCYGINIGPRTSDLELKYLADLIVTIRAGYYSFEMANPRHEHEWQVWQTVKLPDDKVLVPGCITQASVIVEHPELVAERIVRLAKVVGRERVIAGADCGFASTLSNAKPPEIEPEIVWAKFDSLVAGARLREQSALVLIDIEALRFVISMKRKILIALFAITAVVRCSDNATAEPVADFFKGKTINIVVPFGAGGTSQDYAMLMSRNLGRLIPGNPTVILQSMPGAGGLRATLYAYSVAPKDGTWMLLPPDSIAVSQLITPSEARYDTRKFSWLGTVTQTRSVLAVRSDRGVKTVDDLRKIEVFVGSSGSGSQTDMYPTLTNALLGTKLKVVKGYEGSETSTLAVESGELHGTVNTWGYWQRRLELFKSGLLVPILQYGLGRQPELSDVPNFIELVDNEDGKQMVKFFTSFGPIGRGLTLPPGVPADRVTALKRAFAELIKDQAFLDQAMKADLSIEPLLGDEIDRLIIEVIATPPAVVSRVQSLLHSK